MHPTGSCKCQHCGEFFVPDARNRTRQRYCVKPACRRESRARSQRVWLSRPENQDYFRGDANVARVRAWRQANPGYSKRRRARDGVALQDSLKLQPTAAQEPASPDAPVALQDILDSQPPVLVGLIAHLTGTTLQEDIAAMTRKLHSRGRAVLGIGVVRPAYAKTPPQSTAGTAHAVPV